MSKRLTVRVALSITVDPDLWDEVNGTGASAAQVREDVRQYVLYSVQGSHAVSESDGEVRLT